MEVEYWGGGGCRDARMRISSFVFVMIYLLN